MQARAQSGRLRTTYLTLQAFYSRFKGLPTPENDEVHARKNGCLPPHLKDLEAPKKYLPSGRLIRDTGGKVTQEKK